MGIKCSLLGHDFSGSKVEEEREEQGSEVLITIKEVETCDRCGKQRVVSENKEVTSLEAASEDADEDDAADDEADDETGTIESSPGVTSTPDIDAAEDDAELIGEAEDDETASDDDAAPEPDHQPDPVTATDDESDQSVTAADDDAVILGDDDDEPDREPGEWPDEEPEHGTEADEESESTVDAGDQETTSSEEWPDEFGHDEATKTAPEVEWPEEDAPAKSDWEPTENLTKQIDGADIEPTGSAAITVPEGEFECPECGFRTSVEESSLRAGDFCPDCHRGSLEHRAEDQTRKE